VGVFYGYNKMSIHIQSRFHCISLIGCLLISACASNQDGATTIRTTQSGMKVRTTINNSWNTDAKAIANKVYNGAWGFHEMKAGESIVIRLYRNDFLVETVDGAGYYEIVFQIPADTELGKEILLRPIPRSRAAKKQGEYNRLAPMKDGEITAFRYGNPLMGWMKQSKVSKVKIVSMEDTKTVIYLRLKADLDEDWDFDMDEQFTLKVTSQKQ